MSGTGMVPAACPRVPAACPRTASSQHHAHLEWYRYGTCCLSQGTCSLLTAPRSSGLRSGTGMVPAACPRVPAACPRTASSQHHAHLEWYRYGTCCLSQGTCSLLTAPRSSGLRSGTGMVPAACPRVPAACPRTASSQHHAHHEWYRSGTCSLSRI